MRYGLDQLRFGVNYTPPKRWWYVWNDFSADDVVRDLDTIAAIGADHIRIMVLWPYFQPNPTFVSPAHLDRLEVLLTLAKERALDVCVSALVGWLSGYRFVPPFVDDATFYAAESHATQKLFLAELASRLVRFDNFLGFDLGNEINCCWQSADPGGGDPWHKEMLRFVEELAPGRVHVNGTDPSLIG